MSFRWCVLGAGAIVPREGYGCAGHALLVDGRRCATLFDCGPGTIRSLPRVGLTVEQVERVVLSHFHPDHCLDLLALAFARRNPALRPAPPLELVGPRGLAELLERGAELFGARGWTRFEDTSVVEVDVRAGLPALEREGLRLSWAPTGHAPEALAWRAEVGAERLSVTYSGDSGPSDDLCRLAERSDLFVCECSFADDQEVEHHLTPTQTGELARRARVGKLVLTHFYPSLEPERALARARAVFDGPVELSRDGSSHAPELARDPRARARA